MSAGMAGVIETHRYSFNRMGCVCGGWDQAESAPSHAAHVAEELAKAGYGLLDPLAAALADPGNGARPSGDEC